MTCRQSAIVTTAIIGLTTMTAVATPSGAKDPTVPPAASGSTANGTDQATTPAPGAQTDQSAADQNAPATEQSMEARVEQRIDDLHQKLQISAAQEPEWKKFAQTMRENARKMDQAFESRVQQMQNMNALENMRSYARISQQHAQDVQALLPAFQALYGKMSQSQKQAADQVFREDANRGEASQAQHG
jgi:hypothetical protein